MQTNSKKVIIGFIAYNEGTAKYLPFFMDSLKKQTYADAEIIVLDNSEDRVNPNRKYFALNFPEIEVISPGKNLGFAAGYNILINRAIELGADLFTALNPDMIFEPDMIEKMVLAMESDSKIGAVAPKILKWDFEDGQGNILNSKTETIDSYGLYITKEHRFSDLRQGEHDEGGAMQAKEVFGFTGAAVLFDIKALEDAAFYNEGRKEYFDELMFMYKEDCDLSYRLRLAGWKIIFTPLAAAYHDRTASPKGESNWKIALNRRSKSRSVKRWSFLNHWILVLKYKNLEYPTRIKFATFWYQFKSTVFAAIFEAYLLKEFIALWKIRKEIRKRREQLKIRIDIKEIERFME